MKASGFVVSLFALVATTVAGADEIAPQEQQEQRMLVGHNLFSTSYLMPSGRYTLGTYFLGVAAAPWLTVATSPWLLTNYNMFNLVLKAGTPMSAEGNRFSFEFSGFKTFSGFWDIYRQQSMMLRGTWTIRSGPKYSAHLGASHQFFWNDDNPFSLRPTSWNGHRYTVALGVLHEIRLGGDYTLFAETGILGLNYKYPFAHLGVSINRRFSWGYIQAGLSVSRRASPGAPKEPSEFDSSAGYHAWRQEYYSGGLNSDFTIWSVDQWLDFNLQGKTLLHPEIQIQFFF